MRAVVGLGNPGREYEGTRHNAGFEVIALLSGFLRIPVCRRRCGALVGEGSLAGQPIALVMPLTFMNESGASVAGVLRHYRLAPQELLVISDDVDLPVGAVRIRSKGGAGTHNGWKSILEQTGTDLFPRIRIGTGAPPPGRDLADWVLSRCDPQEEAAMRLAFGRAADAAVCVVTRGIDTAMNRYNVRNHEEPSVQQTP